MTMTQNTDGGGGAITLGGTASSMCAISPSDLVSTIGNLISRIENLELIVSQITGANLRAGTLSDISQQVGWVYGVDYMGVPGWIQTEYGTLIPPEGFTLSGKGFQMLDTCTGEMRDYQGVSLDENGVIQFGFKSDGNVCGAKVEQWDAAAAGIATLDYAALSSGVSNSRGITVNSNNLSSALGGATVTIAQTGLYLISATGVLYCSGGAATMYLDLVKNGVTNIGGSIVQVTSPGVADRFPAEISRLVSLTAGNTVSVTYQIPVNGSDLNIYKNFNIIMLST